MKGLGTVNPAITCILFKLQLLYIILMFVLRNLHFHYVSTFRYEEAENKKKNEVPGSLCSTHFRRL